MKGTPSRHRYPMTIRRSRGPSCGIPSGSLRPAANLRTKILDFRGFDSSRILILRLGILMCIGNFTKMLSQRILVGIILVGRLGVSTIHPTPSRSAPALVNCSRSRFDRFGIWSSFQAACIFERFGQMFSKPLLSIDHLATCPTICFDLLNIWSAPSRKGSSATNTTNNNDSSCSSSSI